MHPVEIIPPQQPPKTHIHVASIQAPGWLGAVLAFLTMLAAFGAGFILLFGKILMAAVLVTVIWPFVFSPQFTSWVFGNDRVVFWKVLLVFMAISIVLRIFRRELWPKK